LKDKSLEMLEFPRVKEILAGYTAFMISREMALALMPSADIDQVIYQLKQSAGSRHLLEIEPDFSIGEVLDIREPVVLAARGKMLEIQNLLISKKHLPRSVFCIIN